MAESTLDQIARLEAEKEAKADVFYIQQQAIETLESVLNRQDSGTTYVQPPPPKPKSPNYLMYAGLGLLAFLFFTGRVKL